MIGRKKDEQMNTLKIYQLRINGVYVHQSNSLDVLHKFAAKFYPNVSYDIFVKGAV